MAMINKVAPWMYIQLNHMKAYEIENPCSKRGGKYMFNGSKKKKQGLANGANQRIINNKN